MLQVVFVCLFVCLFSAFGKILKNLHVLSMVNSAAMNIGVHVSFGIKVFPRNMARSSMTVSYGNTSLRSLRSCHTVHHSGSTNLHAH